MWTLDSVYLVSVYLVSVYLVSVNRRADVCGGFRIYKDDKKNDIYITLKKKPSYDSQLWAQLWAQKRSFTHAAKATGRTTL